jgi:ribosomal protein S18 acetylase RimI-like enzyme
MPLADVYQAARIERVGGPHPWSPGRIQAARLHHFSAYCVDDQTTDAVVGYFLYKLSQTELRLHRLVIDPEFRRRGIGTYVFEHLKRRLCPGDLLTCSVDERSVDSQHFLKKQGMTCVNIRPRAGEAPGSDLYDFALRRGHNQRPLFQKHVERAPACSWS